MKSKYVVKNCAICYAETVTSSSSSSAEENISCKKLYVQLNVIFILRNIFEVESDELGSFLRKWGNPGPEEWINLCEKCDKDVTSIRNLFEKLHDITREYERAKCGLQERIRASEENRTNSIHNHEVVHESRSSYCRRRKVTPFPPSCNPFIDGDLKACELAQLQIQNRCHFKTEVEEEIYGDRSLEMVDSTEDMFSQWNSDQIGCDISISASDNDNEDTDEDYDFSGSGSGTSANNSEVDEDEDHIPPPKRKRVPPTRKKKVPEASNLHFDPSSETNADVELKSIPNSKPRRKRIRKPRPKKPKAPPRPHPRNAKSSLLPSFETDMSAFTYTPDNPAGHCNLCGKHIKKFKRFRDHFRRVHSKSELCKICKETLPSVESLKSHLEKVHNVGEFICELCSKTFLTERRLIRHRTLRHKTQDDKVPVECDLCQKKFSSVDSMKMHRATIHEQRYERVCPICFRRLSTKHYFVKHMKNVHQMKEEDVVIPPPLEKLPPEERQIILENAEDDKEKSKCICHLCGKELKTRDGLRRHMYYVHENPDVWKCDEEGCSDKIFLNEKLLERHKMTKHDVNVNEMKFVCQYCGKEFKTRRKMRKHEFRIHPESSLPFKCTVEQCGQSFAAKFNLVRHLKITHNHNSDSNSFGDLTEQAEVKTGTE